MEKTIKYIIVLLLASATLSNNPKPPCPESFYQAPDTCVPCAEVGC